MNYSASITDLSDGVHQITQDIELKFAFTTPKTLNPGQQVTVSLSNLVAEYEAALLAGKFNDQNITTYLENYAQGSDDSAESADH